MAIYEPWPYELWPYMNRSFTKLLNISEIDSKGFFQKVYLEIWNNGL